MLAAGHGADALGVDVSPNAIAQARQKAAERGSAARFEVADVLDLGQLGLTFDTVVDSGVFHVFDDGDRARYVASLAAVMKPGTTCYRMYFSDRQPGDAGRAGQPDELTAAFRDGWAVDSITRRSRSTSGQVRSAGLAGHHPALRRLTARPPVPERATFRLNFPQRRPFGAGRCAPNL